MDGRRRIGAGGGLVAIALGAATAAAIAGCGGSEPPTEPGSADRTAGGVGPGRGAERIETGDGEGGVELVEIGGFEQPTYVTQPASGDPGHLYVVEQCGRVRRVPLSGGDPETFLDLSDRVSCGGEQGLLSIAFDPGYARNGLLYAYFTDRAGDERVVEYRRAAGDRPRADPASGRELLRIDDFAANHNGGQLQFGRDGALYAGTGDGGGSGDPERMAQDPGSQLGKLLRLDPRRSGRRPEVVALGLRNPWRFSFDRETGALWIGDVGQDTLEEIDSVARVPAGGESLNFGWSAFEGSRRFNPDQRAPGAIAPTLEYGRNRGCSVTGGYTVRDPELPTLYGRYLYADFCEGELRSFVARPGRPARDDRPLGLSVASPSSFGEDAAGRVYVASLDGPVYRLAPGEGQ